MTGPETSILTFSVYHAIRLLFAKNNDFVYKKFSEFLQATIFNIKQNILKIKLANCCLRWTNFSRNDNDAKTSVRSDFNFNEKILFQNPCFFG